MEPVFCPDCIADSTDKIPGDISTTNGIGRKFYGGAEPCPKCGSVVRTLWWTFVDVPIIPLGSYRYRTQSQGVNRSQYWARKSHTRWGQIVKTWLVGFTVAACVVAGVIFYDHWKNNKS